MDHEAAKGTKLTKHEAREGFGIKAARSAAWLAVIVLTVWLLSLTLQQIGGGVRFGRIRFTASPNELNLRPFVSKMQSLRNLGSSVSAVRRSAQAYLFIDVLGNVAVFVPFGASLAVATLLSSRWRPRGGLSRLWLRVSLAGLALSLFIELAQLAIPGRATDVDDAILNTLGTAAGALFIAALFRLRTTVRTNRT